MELAVSQHLTSFTEAAFNRWEVNDEFVKYAADLSVKLACWVWAEQMSS